MKRRPFSAFALFAIIATEGLAHAYNAGTHQRIVEAAVESMVYANSSPAPPDVAADEWSKFVDSLGKATALQGLPSLQTGLEAPYAGSATLGTSSPTGHTIANLPNVCRYHFSNTPRQDLNLLKVGTIRIRDFPYYANVATSDTQCAYASLGPVPDSRPGASLGPTLGRQAQLVDNLYNDSVFWYRPTNAEVFGTQTEAAQRVVDFGLGAIILPFYCLAEALFGHGCNTRDSFDLAEQVNPISFISGFIPGFGNSTDPDYVGVWHFIDIDATFNRYNHHRGMFYENAGTLHPGAVDVGIMVLADLSGLSLNAFVANGPKTYGHLDLVRRTTSEWQAHTIAHTEFSPIDNLGQYGWEYYVRDPTSAYNLGRPLHALGDAAEPQHAAGTTGWGHRPFEDAVDNLRPNLLPAPPTASDPSSAPPFAFRDRVLRIGFDAWKAFRNEQDVHGIVQREARATRDIARNDGDWVYKDLESVNYLVTNENASIREYEGAPEHLRPFVELGVGYAIAFLAHAADYVRDPGYEPDTLCPIDTYFTGSGTGCSPGAPPTDQAAQPLTGDVRQTTSCITAGEACTQTAECCNGIACTASRCQNASQCVGLGGLCAQHADCCNRNCLNGVCSTILK